MATVTTTRAILTSSPMKWAIGGWSFFILENLILSENRSYLISTLGDQPYHIAYGTLSTAAMTSVGYGYVKKVKGAEPLLWSLRGPAPVGAKVAGFVCLSLGLGMASQIPPKVQIPVHFVGNGDNSNSNNKNNNIVSDNTNHDSGESTGSSSVVATADPIIPISGREENKKGWQVRCPFDFTDNKNKDAASSSSSSSSVSGLERITRHPGLWSFGLLGLGNALLVPSLPQRAWLAMPAMVALVGGAHTDSRFRRGMGGTLGGEYDAMTSNVPFLAMATGRQGDAVEVAREFFGGEVKPLNAMVAVGVSGLWVLRRGRGVVPKVPMRSF